MNVCVFCGSGSGKHSYFETAAREFARSLAQHNCTLIYGGGKVGLMGVIADEALNHHGKVIGVIPDFLLRREVGHTNLTKLEVVSSMHERKKRMADLADVFVALPGGMGTLDELAEILTWKQLGLVKGSVALLNTAQYFDPLIAQMRQMVDNEFLQRTHFDQLIIDQDPKKLLTTLGVITV